MHPKARLLATTGVEKDVGSRGKINTQERQSREQIPEVTTPNFGLRILLILYSERKLISL